MKLSHTSENQFPQTHLTINKLLDDCLRTIFPSEDYILENMKNIKLKDRMCSMSYHKGFLLYHTTDENWLAKYLELSYNNLVRLRSARMSPSEQIGLIKKVPFSYIRSYVANSPKFEALCSRYKQNLVGAYIQITQNSTQDDFFAKNLVKVADLQHPQYERLLRDRIVGAMLQLGLDKFSIDLGIELNACLWRQNAREKTFANNFRAYDMKNLVGSKGLMAKYAPDKWARLTNMAEKLYDKWSQLADYNYYQQYGTAIDQLGLATPNMLITDDKAAKLEEEVESLRFTFECKLYNAGQYLTQMADRMRNNSYERR